MAQDALKKAYEAQRQALEQSVNAQKQQAQTGFQATQAQYDQAFGSAKNQYERAYEQALSEYQQRGSNITQQAEDVARQAYVQKMNQQRVAPNILQATGLSGQGYSESVLGRIATNYQRTWSDVMNQRNQGLSEVERLKGLANTERQFGLSQAETQRQFGLSQAQAQLQQTLQGLEGQRGAGFLDIEAQYQRDLANYLMSLQSMARSGSGSGSGSQLEPQENQRTTSGDLISSTANRTTPQMVEQGLSNIQFDPRTGNYSNLQNYLMNYVKKGVINEAQAQSMLNRLLSKYQSTSQNLSGSRNQPTQTRPVQQQKTTQRTTQRTSSLQANIQQMR